MGLIVNGVDEGYLGNFGADTNKLIFFFEGLLGGVPANSSHIGKNLNMKLVTDHSKLQFTYPTGTKDICGNAI